MERIEAVFRATMRLEGCRSIDGAERVRRFRQHMIDLRDYLRSNWNGLRNYAAETRQGRRISSALAESAMSHLMNQRMGKRQPMRWSAAGAHLLLQIRCASSTIDWIVSSASGIRTFGSNKQYHYRSYDHRPQV